MDGEGAPEAAATPADVTALVVAFRSAHALGPCLDALRAEGVRLLVVDNASGDASAEVAEAHGARVIRSPRNEGYGRANNLGARAAESRYLLVCNPDVVVEPGAVTALLAAAERYPEAGLLAPRLVEPSGRVFYQPRSLLSATLANPGGRRVIPEGDACAPFLSGACFLARRDLFLEVGGFDPDIFLFYEDDDLCRRLLDRGRAPVHVHAATARHGRGRSTAPEPGQVFTTRWHQAWSKAYVSAKYGLPNPAPGMLILNGARAALACLTFRRPLIERYAGSAAGALASLLGRSALARHGLDRGR